jgi:TolB-like protein/class 3 adenylate cyclase
VQRRLAAILFADVAGFSRLMGENEGAALAHFRNDRDKVFLPGLKRFDGRLVKSMGDGHLIEFASAVDALRFAVYVQVTLSDRKELADLRYRLGIHLGDIVIEKGDILGDGVNIAARLEKLAEPGGIAVSGAVRDQARGKLHLGFEDLGLQTVHNIAEPVPVFRIAIDDAARSLAAGAVARPPVAPGWSRLRFPALAAFGSIVVAAAIFSFLQQGREEARPTSTLLADSILGPAAKPLVAVLPFNDYGGDEANARFARGITEDIITDLARFPEFGVIARNSVEAYAEGPVDVRKAGEALGAAYVLEGSVQSHGGKLRVTAQLIDSRTGAHIWSERWDRPAADLFAIQSEIAETVANRIGGGAGLVQQTERIAARRKRPSDLNAYDLYLLGTEHLEKVTEEDLKQALRLLSQAVELDPGLARAWVELYHTHSTLGWYGGDKKAETARARAAAERAVELDPSDAEAHAAFAMALANGGDLKAARREFDEALRLAPNNFEILTFYTGYASGFGKPELGAEMAARAIRLNPGFPPWATRSFAYAFFMADRFEEALDMLDRGGPEAMNAWTSAIRAGSLAALDRNEEAKAAVASALARFPDMSIEGVTDDPSMNARELDHMVALTRKAGVPPCAPEAKRADLWEKARLPECSPK